VNLSVPIIQIDPADRRQAAEFLRLPSMLYRDIPQWVPPLRLEARRMLDPRKNPFFAHSQAAFLLARSPAGDVQGRLAVLDNRRYNEYNRERTAFFYLFECVNDRKTARDLFDAGFSCSRSQPGVSAP
jgi:hypothetical protein